MDHDGVRWSVPSAEMCCRCDSPTGNAGKGDDSLYDESGAGPYCHSCYELVAELARLRVEVEKLRTMVDTMTQTNDEMFKLYEERYAEVEKLTEQYRLAHFDWCAESVKTLNLEEEVEKLRADVSWAVRHGACAGYDGSSWPCIFYAPNGTETYEHHKTLDQVEYDGTDASLLPAVRRARETTDGLA